MTPSVPREELEPRLERLRHALRESAIDAALVVQTADLYYFAGTAQDAHLVVPAEGDPVLLVRRSLERARRESPLERVEPLLSFRDLPAALSSAAGVAGGRLGLELDVLPVARYLAYRDRLETYELVDCSAAIRRLRSRKSTWEVERMREAGRMLAAAAARVPETLRAGMTEIDLAAEIELVLRREGHQGTVRMRAFNGEIHYGAVVAGATAAFPGGADTAIVGVGPNAAIAKGASPSQIRRNDVVVVDVVGAFEGYLADQTRCFAVGSPPQVLVDAHDAARGILGELAAAARPGVAVSTLHDLATRAAGGRDGFMGPPGDAVSFLGHGLGLEIDEPPFVTRASPELLEDGTAIALEPKFVVSGVGAVGIENTYVLVDGALECLTTAPEDLIVV